MGLVNEISTHHCRIKLFYLSNISRDKRVYGYLCVNIMCVCVCARARAFVCVCVCVCVYLCLCERERESICE